MVIFGAAGDLTKRKLLPALCNLASGGLLPDRFAVVAVARADLAEDEFRSKMMADVRELMPAPVEADIEEWMAQRLFYVRGDLRDKAL
jgi:glucose-6-phosphate 1-dehydrogenase